MLLWPDGGRRRARRALVPLGLSLALVLLVPFATAGAADPAGAAAVPAAPTPPAIAATAAELLDVHSGQVLFAQNADAEMQPASLAKMMTFDLALAALADGQVQPTTPVTVGEDAWKLVYGTDASTMFLLPAEVVPFKDLLIGMMVPSGNDAALAVADFLGGSEAGFVAQMNAEAKAVGLAHTHYVNSHGLEAAGQYTTAADVAALARHIWQTYPDFAQWTDFSSFTWNKITQPNYNPLVGHDARVNGLKSGHLSSVGWHLVVTAAAGDQQLVAVVLGAQSAAGTGALDETLLDWGFGHFHDVQINWAKALPAKARVWKGRGTSVGLTASGGGWITLVGTASTPAPQVVVHLNQPLVAAIAAGQQVGTADVVYGGTKVASVPILAKTAVARGRLPHVLWDSFRLRLAAALSNIHL